MKRFELTRRAIADLREIWDYVSEDSIEAADRLLDDFYRTFQQLAEMPGMGHKREDLTNRTVPLTNSLVQRDLQRLETDSNYSGYSFTGNATSRARLRSAEPEIPFHTFR